jgi:Homing endonuclease
LTSGKGKNFFINFLRENNLFNNKHIPLYYKTSSRENRLKLLAGLIDTDGHYSNQSSYEIIQKNTTLANDIVFIARSLGYYVSIVKCRKSCMYKGKKREGIYNRMNICGTYNIGIEQIPVLIERKKHINVTEYARNSENSKFTIENNNENKLFYRITYVADDHRLLTSSFKVV